MYNKLYISPLEIISKISTTDATCPVAQAKRSNIDDFKNSIYASFIASGQGDFGVVHPAVPQDWGTWGVECEGVVNTI